MRKRWLVATVALLAACAADPQVGSSPSPEPTDAGKPAPDFTLKTVDGDTFTLSDHLGELPIVLNFWAPW